MAGILIQKDPQTLIYKDVTTEQRAVWAADFTIYDVNADGSKGAAYGPTTSRDVEGSITINSLGALERGPNGDAVAWLDAAKALVSQAGIRAATGFALLAPPVAGITATPAAGATVNSSAAVDVGGESLWRVSMTGTSASNNYVELLLPVLGVASAFSAADVTAEIVINNFANTPGFSIYLGTTGFATSSNYFLAGQLTPSTTASWCMNGVLTAYQFNEPLLTKAGYADETGNQPWQTAKLRFYVNNGATLVVHLRALTVGAMRKKARLAIVGDDGYSSFQTMGVPILEEFGFKSSVAVIRENVGANGFATLAQLQAYVAKGNECIGHGPSDGNGGVGNLWSTYTTNAQRIADINAVRDYLAANGLCTPAGAKCYVWPQGRYCESTSDYSMLQTMIDNGYTAARGVNTPTALYFHKLNAISRKNFSALATPIVGHTWTSSGTEAANITAINARVTALGATRTDSTLMLHRVVGVDAAAQSTEISSNQLRAILANVKTEVDAGRMEVVLYSDFSK